MDFEIPIISTDTYILKYNKNPKRIVKNNNTYVRLTEEEKAQKRSDRAYHRNWKDSIRMPKGKSQRLADLNNKYY
jgi:hypothetical protein|tara:strand:- start:655 stop:879 length:225 start_codon:yes stop_codon:yes gene_type:complete